MSTNSVVAYLNEDGSVVSSYVHYDGYETGVGMMLLEHYNTDKCARDLASTLGYASSLSETVAESHADRVHTDEPETFESMEEFETYLMEITAILSLVISGLAGSGWLLLGLRLLKELARMPSTILLGMVFLGWSLHLFVQVVRL